jgi:hypothetical protein
VNGEECANAVLKRISEGIEGFFCQISSKTDNDKPVSIQNEKQVFFFAKSYSFLSKVLQ